MQNHLRYLFIGTLWLILNYITSTEAQDVTLKDLPRCTTLCVGSEAIGFLCDANDTSCLCSHSNFAAITLQCSKTFCDSDAQILAQAILGKICSSVSTTSSSSTTSPPPATTSSPSTTNQPIQSTPTTTVPTTPTSSTLTTTVVPRTSTPPQATSESSTSTVLLVQTVVVDQPSLATSAAGRLHGSISMTTRALPLAIVCLSSLTLVITAI